MQQPLCLICSVLAPLSEPLNTQSALIGQLTHV